MTENRIRPASVTNELADACSFDLMTLTILAPCEVCDEVETELLAMSSLREKVIGHNAFHTQQ